MEVLPKSERGFTDMKKEMLWFEWQTLAQHYTDDQVLLGEWFYDITNKYSEATRSVTAIYSCAPVRRQCILISNSG